MHSAPRARDRGSSEIAGCVPAVIRFCGHRLVGDNAGLARGDLLLGFAAGMLVSLPPRALLGCLLGENLQRRGQPPDVVTPSACAEFQRVTSCQDLERIGELIGARHLDAMHEHWDDPDVTFKRCF
jgi:hypothetical protein